MITNPKPDHPNLSKKNKAYRTHRVSFSLLINDLMKQSVG